ncbi:MAG: UbiA family prenyltransferase [Planctomycetota bacterium]|jgi:4-hydroxybenzoate polyprenyltransferase
MPTKLRTIFNLVRLPNAISAMADSLAGYLIVVGSGIAPSTLGKLMLTSFLLYAGGVALNDVADARRDSVDRPERPIPSGQIAHRHAALLSVLLMLLGMASAWWISARVGWVALGTVGAIIAYDVLLKNTVLAPGFMGLCRAGNVLIGIACATTWSTNLVGPAVWMWLYVAALTLFARHEAVGGHRKHLVAGTAGITVGILGATFMPTGAIPSGVSGGLVFGLPLLLLAGWRGIRAIRSPGPAAIQLAVRLFVLGIIGLDAAMAASVAGYWAGLAVIVLLVPCALLARMFRVT